MEYRKLMDVEFKEFDEETLDKSWEWLNEPNLKSLTMTPDFDQESQKKWFSSLKNRDDYYSRAVYFNDEPIGVFGIKHITNEDGEVFGYIGENALRGKTAGVSMLQHLIDYAKLRNLESVYCITLKTNKPIYRLCSRFGFEIEKEVDDDKIQMRLYLQ